MAPQNELPEAAASLRLMAGLDLDGGQSWASHGLLESSPVGAEITVSLRVLS